MSQRLVMRFEDATERTTYCQGYPDAVEALVSAVDPK